VRVIEAGMSIPVIYHDNTEDFVPGITLEQLLSAHRIKFFYRFSEGWVTVEAGILRGSGGTAYPGAYSGADPGTYSGTYSGPERRSVTDREETGREQRELWNSRELVKRIYEESPVGIGIFDSFGKLLDANHAYIGIYGLHEISDAGAFNLFVDPNIPAEAKDGLRNAETVRCQVLMDFDEVRTSGLYNTDKSGVMSLDMLISPIVVAATGMCLYVVQVQDISLQKEAEAKVCAIQHSEAIVQRAGGIADDFNNLLQVILGNMYLAWQLETSDRHPTKFLERAIAAALRARELSGRLTSFTDAPAQDRESHFAGCCRRETATGNDAAEQESEKAQSGVGRVLVMDDTEAVRRITGAFLMRLGYEVEFAEDGDEAVRIYEEADKRGQPFDVAILDLTVERGSGAREAIGRLLGLDPGVRAIVSSGYHDAPVMTEFRMYGFKGAIAKPYTMEELARTVDAVKHGR
jgi:CheY-like chemotaxis protein